jgi:hypothetical protein
MQPTALTELSAPQLMPDVSQTRGFMKPTELTDGNVSSSECRGHAETSNGGQESGRHA